jgi:preprotein translocase subunit SecG
MKFKKTVSMILIIAFSLVCIAFIPYNSHAEDQGHYLGSAVKTDRNGYSGSNEIGLNDHHSGWELGEFIINGYTRIIRDVKDNPVFIKTLGDEITLRFNLKQNIDNLNGNNRLVINQDKNGSDEYFGIERTNFGRGALIIRHTNWQNNRRVTKHFNYLPALEAGTDTEIKFFDADTDAEVRFFEEGDYEVALNYEIKRNYGPFGLLSSTYNYRIFFRFSVRNGETMIFLFDAITTSEITNQSVAENGFYIDLAGSQFLEIDVKKEVLVHGANGLIEDTRINRAAKDGDIFTDEGIYTITVSNLYTKQQTTKQIYVGDDPLLKAYMNTEHSINEINDLLILGTHTITNDGDIIPLITDTSQIDNEPRASLSRIIGTILIMSLIIIFIVLILRQKRNDLSQEESE